MKRKNLKNNVFVILCFLVFVLSIIMPIRVIAQESIFDYLEQALIKIVSQSTFVNLANYDYCTNGNCLYGAYLSKGSSQTLNKYFEKDVNYFILGAGDNDIIDLDLSLLSSSGEVLLKDTKVDDTPVLQFKPNYSGKMKLKLTNYNSIRAGFCVMVILQESYSGNFSLYQISQALDNVIKNAQITYLISSRFARGTFCLSGGRLNEGENNFMYNMQPSPGSYALVGAGSNNISDVDLFIIEQHGRDYTSGTTIAKDTARDNHPICFFTVYSGYYYLLKHKNYSSYGNSSGFVFSVLLQL